VLTVVMAELAARTGRAALDVVDVGAGTGGLAVAVAAAGHRVTVVDPSPDALSAARWRAAEAGVTLTEVQGEAGDLPALIGESGADLVICHNVLEYVDSPAAAMAAITRILRPGGTVSVLAANAVAAVLQRALAGKYAEARALLSGIGPSEIRRSEIRLNEIRLNESGLNETESTRTGPAAPAGRRFTLPELEALIEGAGLRVGDSRGIRVFAGLLPGAGGDPASADALRELEEAAAACPPLRDIAARIHVLASLGS
jgi:SAM-dependent methyltransferase